MSWLSKLWNSIRFKQLIDLIKKILGLVAGAMGDKLHQIAKEEVIKAEQSGAVGSQKFKMAYEGIKNRLKSSEIPDSLIRFAIEAVVQSIDPKFPI